MSPQEQLLASNFAPRFDKNRQQLQPEIKTKLLIKKSVQVTFQSIQSISTSSPTPKKDVFKFIYIYLYGNIYPCCEESSKYRKNNKFEEMLMYVFFWLTLANLKVYHLRSSWAQIIIPYMEVNSKRFAMGTNYFMIYVLEIR